MAADRTRLFQLHFSGNQVIHLLKYRQSLTTLRGDREVVFFSGRNDGTLEGGSVDSAMACGGDYTVFTSYLH